MLGSDRALDAAGAGTSVTSGTGPAVSSSHSWPGGGRPSEMADRCAVGTTVIAERWGAPPWAWARLRSPAEIASMRLGTLGAGNGDSGSGDSEVACESGSIPVSTSCEAPGRGERCGLSVMSDERP